MRVVFMGTPAFAAPVLDVLLSSEVEVVGVYTQPDKPSGRGGRQSAPPMKLHAQEKGLLVLQPASLRSAEALEELERLRPDVIVVAAYGKLLPSPVLDLPDNGAVNIHPSLLPRYRGPSPVVSAMLEGEANTGVTLMLMDGGMDTGPIVAQRPVLIGAEETAGGLTDRLFHIGAELLGETLHPWCRGEIQAQEQDPAQATVTRKYGSADGEASWDNPAEDIARRIRAFNPWPGVYTLWNGKRVKITAGRALAIEGESPSPGLVMAVPGEPDTLGVATGSGLLVLEEVQLEGKGRMGAAEFARGHKNFLGSRLSS